MGYLQAGEIPEQLRVKSSQRVELLPALQFGWKAQVHVAGSVHETPQESQDSGKPAWKMVLKLHLRQNFEAARSQQHWYITEADVINECRIIKILLLLTT